MVTTNDNHPLGIDFDGSWEGLGEDDIKAFAMSQLVLIHLNGVSQSAIDCMNSEFGYDNEDAWPNAHRIREVMNQIRFHVAVIGTLLDPSSIDRQRQFYEELLTGEQESRS